jgi:hypothetical protein
MVKFLEIFCAGLWYKLKQKLDLNTLSRLGLLAIVLGLGFGGWVYIQAEILTYTSDINGSDICKSNNLKYFKILSFDKIVGKSEILCIRENLSQSTYLKLNLIKTDYGRKQSWEIIYTQNIYENNSIFWPIYV